MLALGIVESDRCRCGGWISETTSPEAAEEAYETKKKFCWRCRAHEKFMTAQAVIDSALRGTENDQTWGRLAYTIPVYETEHHEI
jgi:hypothetical protein